MVPHLHVRTAPRVGWALLVMSLASTVSKSQWTAVSANAKRVGRAKGVTLCAWDEVNVTRTPVVVIVIL